MKTRTTYLAAVVASLLAVSQAQAANDGYWNEKGGSVWRSGSGECIHTGFWSMDMAIVGCDGKVAESAPEPLAAPAPVAMPSVDAKVTFGFDRVDLDAAATAAIDTLVSEGKTEGKIRSVKVTGHADRIGTEDYNLDLSLRRASAVGDYLTQSAGIDAQSVELAGKGESQPLIGCDDVRGATLVGCLAPNRRVEIILELF